MIDANQRIEEQQGVVRSIMTAKVDLKKYSTSKAS